MNIIVTGSVAFDYLMHFPGRFSEHILPDQLEHISLSFLVDQMLRRTGGTAANIAYTLALLGETPRLMASVGQDFGAYRAKLEAVGVDTSLARAEVDLYTASFFVNTDLDGNQIASFYAGAMGRAGQLSVEECATEPVDLVTISPNAPDAMQKYAAECHELGVPYVYDPSQQIVRLSPEQLQAGIAQCALLVSNEYEYHLLLEKTGLSEEELKSAPSQALVLTLGSAGSRIWADGERYDIPPVVPERVDDPTGVGDAYRAGLIKGLSLGVGWAIAGRMGALAASWSLEEPGGQGHRFDCAEFASRFRDNFDDEGALDELL
jgi:adenosine kinase